MKKVVGLATHVLGNGSNILIIRQVGCQGRVAKMFDCICGGVLINVRALCAANF